MITFSGDQIFGVEITEVFANNSNARIRNIDSYVQDLIENKNYRHKEDKEILKVKRVQVFDKDNIFTEELDVIISNHVKVNDYIDKVLARINEKHIKFKQYTLKAQKNSLILHDTEHYFYNYDCADIAKSLFTCSNRDYFIHSEFNEIYFITSIKERKDSSVFICCKVTSLLIDLYLFGNVIELKYPEISDNEQFILLTLLLNKQGYKVVLKKDTDAYIVESLFGQIIISSTNTSVYLPFELPFINNLELVDLSFGKIDDVFFTEVMKFRDNNICNSIIYNEVKQKLYYQKKDT